MAVSFWANSQVQRVLLRSPSEIPSVSGRGLGTELFLYVKYVANFCTKWVTVEHVAYRG